MDWLVILHPLNGLLMIVVPLGLGIYLTRKTALGWKLWGIGAAIFVISQIGHLPFNQFLLNPFIAQLDSRLPEAWQLPVTAVLLGLSAGVFEETARYGMYRWWAKDARSWRKGILAGAGHGGIEAILLGILVLLTFIQMFAIRQADPASLVPAGQVELARQQITAYWSAAWYDALLGAVERVFTIIFHIAASLLVLQVFTRRQWWWLAVAVLWHAILDAGAVYLVANTSIYLTELALGVSALLNLAVIWLLRQPEPALLELSAPVSVASPLISLPDKAETALNIEETRYN